MGLLPQTALGAAWAGDFDLDTHVALTAGALWLSESRTRGDEAGFGLTAGWLGGCAQTADETMALRLCGLAYAGALHAVVYQLQPASPGDRAWTALALQPALRWTPWPPLVLELGADALVPLVRDRFHLTSDGGTLFQQAEIAGLLWLSAGLSI